jgi:hypothetical protein
MRSLARARDPVELPQVVGWIHDQIITQGCVAHDREARILDIEYWLMMYEKRELIRNRLIWKDWRYPLARSILRIREVESWELTLDSETGTYELTDITFDPERRLLTLDTTPAYIVEATVISLNVEALTSDEPTGWRRIWEGLIGQGWRHGKGWLHIPGYSDSG